MSHITVKMGDRGRVVIPGKVRRRLGLEAGDRMLLTEEDGELRLRPLRKRIEDLRGAYADLAPDRSLADELVAERRTEAGAE